LLNSTSKIIYFGHKIWNESTIQFLDENVFKFQRIHTCCCVGDPIICSFYQFL